MMIADIRNLYRTAWAFALACPVLFAIPVLVEFAQHVVELRRGMYVDEAGARAADGNTLRLQFGFAKTLAITLPTYWFARYILLGSDARRAGRIEMPAFGLWLALFALAALQSWWALFGPSLADLTGMDATLAGRVAIGIAVAWQILAIYLSAWLAAWPVGNARIGPLRSIAIMYGSFWYAVGLMIAGIVPLMALHYALAILAVLVTPTPVDWLVMAFDAGVTGLLALTIAGSVVYAAMRAVRRRGVALLPEGDGASALDRRAMHP